MRQVEKLAAKRHTDTINRMPDFGGLLKNARALILRFTKCLNLALVRAAIVFE